ncbi:MAG: translation elongation factor Ts [Bacillota bacterium]|nr:translation elongation factor Ts [Bacillota bacterium]
MITAQAVKELREITNCGMMDCKKALTEVDGDMEKAIEWLREKGLAAAAKKAGRIASEGLVDAYVNDDNTVAAIVEINSETDFVAKNSDFQAFVKNVARIVAETNPADIEDLKTKKYIDSDLTVEEALREKILTIGENMNIRRFARYEGAVVTYIHGGGRIGVIVQFDTDVASKPEFFEVAKDVALQIAASAPTYLDRSVVPADVLEKEKEILKAQALNEGKPEAIVEKMVMGRISKYYKENCLVDQEFVKDPEISVSKMLDVKGKEMGGTISVKAYDRFEKGEGLEKREDDFAAEVEKMVKK